MNLVTFKNAPNKKGNPIIPVPFDHLIHLFELHPLFFKNQSHYSCPVSTSPLSFKIQSHNLTEKSLSKGSSPVLNPSALLASVCTSGCYTAFSFLNTGLQPLASAQCLKNFRLCTTLTKLWVIHSLQSYKNRASAFGFSPVFIKLQAVYNPQFLYTPQLYKTSGKYS